MMTTKIQGIHLERPAYVYLRQSTMSQVRHNRESTERQYALKEKALTLGWRPDQVRLLDGDLGLSGSQAHRREDFKTLVADVSMGKVGAVFALEASRLSRSNTDWHRLLELCSLTGALIIDEDGCYDPADFNDQLLLGLKGTMSQAELHFIRARLQGGRLNKAKKGDLRSPLAIGYVYDPCGRLVFDPDSEVQGAIRLLFKVFRDSGSAYQVVNHFARSGLKFPKRRNGGAMAGKLTMVRLSHSRVCDILRNPVYAGTYAYGRYAVRKAVDANGKVRSKIVYKPQDQWSVTLYDRHPAYISKEDYDSNREIIRKNGTNRGKSAIPGPAREGLALLQGLLFCGECGRKLSTRYAGNGGIYPGYLCVWRLREGFERRCVSVAAPALDEAVSQCVLEVLTPKQVELALKAFEELESRAVLVDRQWQLKVQRAEYETELIQRRYEAVDPANRVVAASLEKGWNDALINLEDLRQQAKSAQEQNQLTDLSQRRSEIVSLGTDLPRLWQAASTKPRDRKRILRLLIKDIFVKKSEDKKCATLGIRWQGGARHEIKVKLPISAADQMRHSVETVDRVRTLSATMTNQQIADVFNEEGLLTRSGHKFSQITIRHIRAAYGISGPVRIRSGEMTVKQLAEKYNVGLGVVYYWMEKGVVESKRIRGEKAAWIKMDAQTDARLSDWCLRSVRINKFRGSIDEERRSAL